MPGRAKLLAVTPGIGRFYNVLLRACGAARVLEAGTSAGYSTIWFAEAVAGREGARITTIEEDAEKAARARANFRRAGVDGLVDVRLGRAAEEMAAAADGIRRGDIPEFDFVFVDADKERCVEYFDLALPLLRTGGVVGIDNVLKPERFAPHMAPLVRHAGALPLVRSVVVPIDNGELVCAKL